MSGPRSVDNLLISSKEEFEKFIQHFCDLIDIYDPLDKEILDQLDEMQNVLTEDLLNEILDMPSIGSEMVTVPMTDEMYEQIKI